MFLVLLLTLSLGNATKLFRSSSFASDQDRRRMQVTGLGVFGEGDSVLVGVEPACIASIIDAEQGTVAVNYADGITYGEHVSVNRLTLVEAGVGCAEAPVGSGGESDDEEEFEGGALVKLCLFYANPSGHARTDPIINQQCASDHMHTFYGPLHLHPATSYDDLITTPPQYSTSPVEENQSSYWHPSIYRRSRSEGDSAKFELVENLEVGPYYRWDNSVSPPTQAYPPGFRMIAHTPSTDPGAQGKMMTECCNIVNGGEQCEEWPFLHFPARNCDFVGIALAMPTCWDGVELGDNNNHVDHMRYTTNGEVAGPCPDDFPVRLPEVQLFVRILSYQGGDFQYLLSSGSVGADSEGNGDNQNWHVDFFNGWKEGTFQTLIDNCPIPEQAGYNPYCECLHTIDEANALPNDITIRPRELSVQPMCEADVRSLMIDEPTHFVDELPRGTCQGPELKDRSYTNLDSSLFSCDLNALDDETNVPDDSNNESTSGLCAELEAKYPECDDEYTGDMECEPSEEDMEFYESNCQDSESVVDEEGAEESSSVEEDEEADEEDEYSSEEADDESSTTASQLLTTEAVVANPSRARMQELKSIYRRKPNAVRWAAVSSQVDVIMQEFPNMEARIEEYFEQQESLLERSFSKKRWKKSKKAFKQAWKVMKSQGEL